MLLETSAYCPLCHSIDFGDYWDKRTQSIWNACQRCGHHWEEFDDGDEEVDEINWADYLEDVQAIYDHNIQAPSETN